MKRDLERQKKALTTMSLRSPSHLQLDQEQPLCGLQVCSSVSSLGPCPGGEDKLLQGRLLLESKVRTWIWGGTRTKTKHFFWIVVIYFQLSDGDTNAQKYKNFNKMTQLESNIARMQTKGNWPPNMWPQPLYCHGNANAIKSRTTLFQVPITNIKSELVDAQ